jgi:putative MATE family efflux protein
MSAVSPPKSRLRTWLAYFLDKEYFHQLARYSLPIMTQQVIISLLNMVGVVMVGQKGEAAVAAVGLAGQVFFLLNLSLFGVGSGSAIFTSQLWGKKDIPRLRKVLSLCLALSLGVSLVFFLLSEFFPAAIIGIFSTDPQVIRLGGAYLGVFAWSFLFFTVSYMFSMMLRSTGNVRLPMFVSIGALAVNTLLSYGLIFGKLGLPVLGIQGAAVAVVISRFLECAVLLILIYAQHLPVAATIGELLSFDLSFILKVLKPVLPVVLNEFLWSMGTTLYSVVYARMGTASIAAINMISTIDNLAFAVLTAIGTATAIMVGHRIGEGEEQEAFRSSVRSLIVGAVTGLLLGGIALLGADHILALYKVSPIVLHYAETTLLVFSACLWLRGTNSILVVGVLRAGGDTRFCLILDGFIIWLVGVPATLIGAFVFHLPIYWVYLLAMTDEVTKCIIGMPRVISRRWIHNLALAVSVESLPEVDGHLFI